MNENNFIVAGGIFSEGYGFAPKVLMRDSRLTVEAKSIYCYISSFAGAGMRSFPSVELMVKELGISRARFYKHRKQLIDIGYVSIEQMKGEDKKFQKNIYVLNAVLPCTRFMSTENPHTENPTAGNLTTNSNSLNSNSLNSNSKTNTLPQAANAGEEIPKENKSGYSEKFEQWWECYPKLRRNHKKGCYRKWKSEKLEEIADQVIFKLNEQVAYEYNYLESESLIPLSSTYMNQERYNNAS